MSTPNGENKYNRRDSVEMLLFAFFLGCYMLFLFIGIRQLRSDAKTLYPDVVVESQSCEVVHLPELQEETYLVSGSEEEGNQIISFYCSDQSGSTELFKLSVSDVNLVPISGGQDSSFRRFYTQVYTQCPEPIDYVDLLIQLEPWNFFRCRTDLVDQRLEVPSDWVR